MRVEQSDDGSWQVVDAAGQVVATGMSNAGAWRWLDRHSCEPVSPNEHRHDYVWTRLKEW